MSQNIANPLIAGVRGCAVEVLLGMAAGGSVDGAGGGRLWTAATGRQRNNLNFHCDLTWKSQSGQQNCEIAAEVFSVDSCSFSYSLGCARFIPTTSLYCLVSLLSSHTHISRWIN